MRMKKNIMNDDTLYRLASTVISYHAMLLAQEVGRRSQNKHYILSPIYVYAHVYVCVYDCM